MFSTVSDEEVIKLAKKVGRKVHRDYTSVDRDEITSAALVKLAEVNLEAPTAGHVFRVLERAAIVFAAKERYRMMLETSQYIYLPKEVRGLLQQYWNPDSWDVPTARDDYLYAAVEQSVVAVSLMDIRDGLESLKPNHRRDLERKFRDGQDVHTQQVHNAVDALTRFLNRLVVQKYKDHNGPGARKAMSNAKAQHITEELGGEHERDALDKVQAIYKHSPSKPAGTYFNWRKYEEDDGDER